MPVKSIGVKKAAPGVANSIPGQVEKKIERASAVWKRRTQGASMTSLAIEFGVSITTIHNYIEEIRKELRESTIDLAAQEREQSLCLIDTTIEQVVPHILEGELQKIQEVKQRQNGPVIITIAEYEARDEGLRGHDEATGP
jgi:transposase